jgi:hypothetical protein
MSFAERLIPGLALTFVFVVAAACAPSAPPGGGSQVDAADPRDFVDGSVAGGQIGDPCERAQQCAGELICDPATNTCAEPFPCSEHDECGQGAHCNQSGMCEQSGPNSPCDRDYQCAVEDVCIGGFCGCRGATFQAEPIEVNMLVVLDRSGSMWQTIELGGGDSSVATKWEVALDAIDYMLDEFAARANFGMSVFPHSELSTEETCHPDGSTFPVCTVPDACIEGNTLVDVGPNNEGAIRSALDATLPACCTPTGATLATYLGYPQLSDPTADNYILLVADGEETCGGDAPAIAAELRAQDSNVRTFVIGFGDEVDPVELTAIAEAGGTARDGDLAYYQADNAQELEDAFAEIGGRALNCSYSLGGVPPDPQDLYAYFDGQPVPRDPSRQNGWDYDAGRNEIVFFGAACDALQNGDVEDLAILQTCDLIVD